MVYCMEQQHPALFMQMRLGKTKVAINTLQHHGNNLVVAPLSVLGTWHRELLAEGLHKVVFLEGRAEERLTMARQCCQDFKSVWCLTNYETLRLVPQIADLPWFGVVLDESSKLRNPSKRIWDRAKGAYRRAGQTVDVCLTRFQNTQRRFILSGLPAPESLLDYFNQMAFLDGQFMGCRSYWQFRAKHFNLVERAYKWYPRKGVREKILVEVKQRCFVLSREQVGMANQRIYESREVEPSAQQVRLLKEVRESYSVTVGKETRRTQWAVVAANWMNQISGGYIHGNDGRTASLGSKKTRELLDLLQGELAEEQCVVWFRFNAELWAVREAVMTTGIRCECIWGNVPPEERNLWCQKFSKGEFRVLLVQLKCGKFGLDLSAASTAIYYSNGFSHEDRAQSEDRIEHPRKKEPLLFVDLLTKDSSDAKVLRMLKQKVAVGKSFYDEVLGR